MRTVFDDFCRFVFWLILSGVVTLALAALWIESTAWTRLMHSLFMFANAAAFCRYILWRDRFNKP